MKNKSKQIKEMGGEKSETLAHRVVNGLGLEQTYPEFDVLETIKIDNNIVVIFGKEIDKNNFFKNILDIVSSIL